MSKIEWTDATWNPILGCARVSPGCQRCYAERTCAWIGRMNPGSPHGSVVQIIGGEARWNNTVVRNTDARFYAMRSTRPRTPPRKVFVNSQSDLFHESAVAQGLMAAIYYEMRVCRWNVYQVLTKRPEAAAAFYASNPSNHHLGHVCFGVSLENADVLHRLDILRGMPVSVRFLSVEPLLGPLGRIDLSGIDWVIVGGESGPKHRPMDVDWAREVRDQCAAAGVPFFFKQFGGPADDKGGGKNAILDGRRWAEFPWCEKDKIR